MTPTHSNASSFSIRRVSPEAVRPLRAAILRPGRPLGESTYPLDEHSEAAHFGAIEDISGEIVGSASVFLQPADALDSHVPRLAGAGARDGDGERDAW